VETSGVSVFCCLEAKRIFLPRHEGKRKEKERKERKERRERERKKEREGRIKEEEGIKRGKK
jgi:hypothetical protein